jgi:23S rRNA pseudouridine2457 synthase
MPLILLNKPFRVLSQFTDPGGRATLERYVEHGRVYPAGRLDYDSEGLLLLTDDGALQARVSQPKSKLAKVYQAQVEGAADAGHAARLLEGVRLRDGNAVAAQARVIGEPPGLWPRDPPIRERRGIPVSWIEIALTSGRNRQVRRMTAAVGLPTLRLIRVRVGPFALDGLQPGESRELGNDEAWRRLDTNLCGSARSARMGPAP